jgi:hypothetical protein
MNSEEIFILNNRVADPLHFLMRIRIQLFTLMRIQILILHLSRVISANL